MNSSTLLLTKELNDLQKYSDYFSVGIIDNNIFIWDICIFGLTSSLYEEVFLNGTMYFPKNYPHSPPKFKFNSPMFHPNIYNDGTVCLSILHSPGEDEFGYESSNERWRPINTVYSIIQSIINLLNEPNIESPANIDASILFKNNIIEYNKKVKNLLKN